MTSEEGCLHDMFVEVIWKNKRLAVPLSQLEAINLDSESEQAFDDWQYWLAQGYVF